MTANNLTIAPGTIINNNMIIEEIGSGGMGSVYRAYDEALSRMTAIKIMHQASDKTNELGIARFQREASAIANLDHSGIVKIYSYGEYENRPYFVMEYVDGWSIKDFVTRALYIRNSEESFEDLKLSGYVKEGDSDTPYFLCDHAKDPIKDKEYPKKVRKLMQSAASALAAAHQQGIIHRDIKSSNLLIVDDTHLKLIDFGLVKQDGDNDLTQTDLFMGTLKYAAPEQLMGKRGVVSFETDVYSLGVVMYELVTLSHPIQAEDPAAIVTSITQGKIKRPRVVNPNISTEFEKIILKCLAKEPSRRYRNAGELAVALQQEGESQSWFAGFTEMLKGWFFSEPKSNSVNKPKVRPRIKTPRLSTNPSELTDIIPLTPSQLFLKSARKNLYRNFAIADAMEDLKQSYEIDSANVDTLFLICFALLTASDNSKIKHYVDTTEKLLDANDEYALSKFNLIKTVFINRDYEEGLSQAKRLHSIYPDDYDIFFMIFFCYETLGDYKEAIAVSYEIQKLGKKNNIVAVAQSECYFSIMDFDNAIKVLQDRITEFPRLYNLQVKVFQALMLSGHYKEAMTKTGDIIKKDPNNMLMHVNHARAQIFNDDLKGAYNTMRKVVGMPGDDMLRAICYCSLYKLSVILGKENPERYLQQARTLRPGIYFPTNEEMVKHIESEQMKGIDEEVGHPIWFPAVRYYAHRICADTMAPKSFTIGNFGCTSFFVIGENGEYTHSNIFSNFNVYDIDERFSQLWLPEVAQTPFIDEKGNILTASFHEVTEEGSGVVTITHLEPWKARTAKYIYCSYTNGNLKGDDKKTFVLPSLPQPACLSQAFIVIVPKPLEIESISKVPDEQIDYLGFTLLCFYQFLYAGEIFKVQVKLK